DLSAPPALIEITRNGRKILAVAQTTKQGLLFLFDRVTGKPIYGVEERPVPKSDQQGEDTWPTQPFPLKPPPIARTSFTPAEVAKVTPEHQKFCESVLAQDGGVRASGPYTPYGRKITLNFPSMFGGGNWGTGGGVAFDPELGYLFANTQDLGTIFKVVVQQEGAGYQVTRVSPAGDVGGLGGRGGFGGNIGVQFWNPESLMPCQQPPWGRLT